MYCWACLLVKYIFFTNCIVFLHISSYTYIKEIIKGESYIELSEEERQCLEKTIYQEEYDIKDMKEERPSVKKKNEIEKEQKDKEKEERE